MKDVKIMRAAKSGQFILTSKRGEKISAVEGMKATPRVTAAVKSMAASALSSADRRAHVKEAIRKK